MTSRRSASIDGYDADADALGFLLGSLAFDAEGDGVAVGDGEAEGDGSAVADDACLKVPKVDGS